MGTWDSELLQKSKGSARIPLEAGGVMERLKGRWSSLRLLHLLGEQSEGEKSCVCVYQGTHTGEISYADLICFTWAFLIGHLYLSGMYMPYGKATS